MSVGDKYEEGKNALNRASMTYTEWYWDVLSEISADDLAAIAESSGVDLIKLAAEKFIADRAVPVGGLDEVFCEIIKKIAKEKMLAARDAYEEEHGRRV